MPNEFLVAAEVALPAQSGLLHAYPTVDLADAFAIQLPADACQDPDVLARFIFSQQPAWIGVLTRVRDLLVAGFGLKTTRQLAALGGEGGAARVGPFKVYSTNATEIVVGEDDRHLDFRLSVLRSPGAPGGCARLTLSTVVHCHTLPGRSYLFMIAPFHRMVVRASLRRAARVGWPRAGLQRARM